MVESISDKIEEVRTPIVAMPAKPERYMECSVVSRQWLYRCIQTQQELSVNSFVIQHAIFGFVYQFCERVRVLPLQLLD
jgi:hypothetical protein